MRRLSRALACAALALVAASPAWAQNAPPAPSQSAPESRSAPSARSVSVVDIASLPAEAQRRINARTLEMSESDIRKMRDAIDSMPEASTALMEKGLRPSQVIAIDTGDDGAVTLITRTAI